jgi:hypothetical protein
MYKAQILVFFHTPLIEIFITEIKIILYYKAIQIYTWENANVFIGLSCTREIPGSLSLG